MADMPRLSKLLLATWLGGVLAFGRSFSTLGISPFFLGDLLVLLAILLSARTWWPQVRQRPIRTLCLAALFLALFTAQAVLRGYAANYAGALKGLTLGFYPLVAVALAGLLAAEPKLLDQMPRWLLYLPVIGYLAQVLILSVEPIAASYGLYLGFGMAFAVLPACPHRWRLLLFVFGGTAALLTTTPSRGPSFAIVVAAVASYGAHATSGGRFGIRLSAVLTAMSMLSVLCTFGLALSLTGTSPADVPVVGPVVKRTLSITESGGVDRNNVAVRGLFWSYALESTADDNFIFGRGASHPVEVTYGGNDFSRQETGVHNSFVGYVFYNGYPSGVVVAIVFLAAWKIAWRERATHRYAPAVFGCVSAAVAISLTNVALETPYIAGPAWAAVGAAFALRFTKGPLRQRETQRGCTSERKVPLRV